MLPTKSESECRVGSSARYPEGQATRKGFQAGVQWAFATVIERLNIAEDDLSEQPGDYGRIAQWIERRSGSW